MFYPTVTFCARTRSQFAFYIDSILLLSLSFFLSFLAENLFSEYTYSKEEGVEQNTTFYFIAAAAAAAATQPWLAASSKL